jgi:hypothetical protein
MAVDGASTPVRNPRPGCHAHTIIELGVLPGLHQTSEREALCPIHGAVQITMAMAAISHFPLALHDGTQWAGMAGTCRGRGGRDPDIYGQRHDAAPPILTAGEDYFRLTRASLGAGKAVGS